MRSLGSAGCGLQELEQRYGEFRVAVQSALDVGEAVSYREIVQRLGRRDRRMAHAAVNPITLRSGGGGGGGHGGGGDGSSGGNGGGGGNELPAKGAHVVVQARWNLLRVTVWLACMGDLLWGGSCDQLLGD